MRDFFLLSGSKFIPQVTCHTSLLSPDITALHRKNKTYSLYEGTGVVKYARKFLLRGRIYAGIGIIGIMQLSTWRLAVGAVATQTASAGGFRDLAASILQVNQTVFNDKNTFILKISLINNIQDT